MTVELVKFVQKSFQDSSEWQDVNKVADLLSVELNREETYRLIVAANRPKASSSEVQAAFRPAATLLGFDSEKTGLFKDSIPGLRPDYYLAIQGTGIILEVERGKTTTNNMDLLDFWKCHLCPKAHYLFLLVPKALKHNDGMTPKKEFTSVKRRLAFFFEEANYTNVRGLALYGY